MSVMEDSHRSPAFVACAAAAEQKLRQVLSIPDEYKVLFLQGGASGQFAAIPMNLGITGSAAYINTGQWSKKAIQQGKAYLDVDVVADEAASGYTTVPAQGSFEVPESASFLHYTPNETIGGVEFGYEPTTSVPLVADFSSSIASRPLDVSKFGLISAGTQKNLGPAGLAIVIVHEDLVGRARPETPAIWNYEVMAKADSMANTFTWYLLGLILDWLVEQGGLVEMERRNKAKSDALYAFIDASDFYANPVAVDARSRMNIPFTLADPSKDAEFLSGAVAAGMTNLKGHRSVGGMRASIYNAMPFEGVQTLIDYMAEFARTRA
jgi:phosphoserine aminotransferase